MFFYYKPFTLTARSRNPDALFLATETEEVEVESPQKGKSSYLADLVDDKPNVSSYK